jgi:hypothetical protein
VPPGRSPGRKAIGPRATNVLGLPEILAARSCRQAARGFEGSIRRALDVAVVEM